MTIYIIRHGETEFNKVGKVQGKIDTELNHTGNYQAKLFHEYYRTVPFDVIITSALKRTHQTVAPFIKKNPDIWEQIPELDEICWGIHEGQPNTPTLDANFHKMMHEWESGNYDAAIEGGESINQLAVRVQKSIDYLRNIDANNVLVCTHGRTLLCLITLLKGEPLKNMNQFKHQNTCLYIVHYLNGEFIFEVENDLRHLQNTISQPAYSETPV